MSGFIAFVLCTIVALVLIKGAQILERWEKEMAEDEDEEEY